MHEIIRLLADSSGPPSTDNSVKIAIITAVSVVIAAAITAFATTFTRGHDEPDSDQDYVDELVRRAESAEDRCQGLEAKLLSETANAYRYREYLVAAGYNPDTGLPVSNQRGGVSNGEASATT